MVIPDESYNPVSGYYQDKAGNWYGVARLLELAKDLPVFDLPLAGIDLALFPWDVKNILDLVHHINRVEKCDNTLPILLDWNGTVCDGWHRIVKSILQGKTTIRAIRLTERISPCERAK